MMMACVGCEWQLRSGEDGSSNDEIVIDRYDLLEHHYVTTGDIAAIQQMNTQYPVETRLLVEDVLQLGPANDPEMKIKLLNFFQDSTLQILVKDVMREFADLSDIESQLSESFEQLGLLLPGIEIPHVYTQFGSLDQSIVAGEGLLGISLDKYLGSDYPLYQKYGYSERQRNMMTRSFIVPDCLGFYLLSLYPLAEADTAKAVRDSHMGKIQYVVNQAMGQKIFDNEYVRRVEQLMQHEKNVTVAQLFD